MTKLFRFTLFRVAFVCQIFPVAGRMNVIFVRLLIVSHTTPTQQMRSVAGNIKKNLQPALVLMSLM